MSKKCHLNIPALSDLNSFYLSISFVPSNISDSASLSTIALIDSSSSHCFIDPSLIKSASLHTYSILLVPL